MTTWTQIASMDAPSSNVFAFTGLTLTGYIKLQVVMSGIKTGTDGTDIKVTLYTGAAEQTGATAYRWGDVVYDDNNAATESGDASDPSIQLTDPTVSEDLGNDTGEGLDGLIELDNPNSTALHKRIHWEMVHTNPTGEVTATNGVGVLQNTGATDGIKIAGTNNLTAGHVRLLGLQ